MTSTSIAHQKDRKGREDFIYF